MSTKKSKSKSKQPKAYIVCDPEEITSSTKDESQDLLKQNASKKSVVEYAEAVKKSGGPSQMKSLVTVPLPSLLSSSTPVSSKNSEMKPQVVQNKAGSEIKGSAAKSLMDLQFDDRTLSRNNLDEKRKQGKPGLLPEPYDLSKQYHTMGNRKKRFDHNLDNQEFWPRGNNMNSNMRRSWTENELVSSPIFSPHHKPLVVESEPLTKVRKTSNSPHALLESSAPIESYAPPYMKQTKPRHDRPPQNLDKIVTINCNKRKTSCVLIIPSSQPWVHLHGRARITVLKGVVTIMAHTLVPGTSYEVFSPSTNCLLSLQVDSNDNDMTSQEVEAEIKKHVHNGEEIEGLSKKSIGILKVEKLKSIVCDYLTTFAQFSRMFTTGQSLENRNSSSFGATLFSDGFKIGPEFEMSVPCMSWNESYNEALDKWLETIDKRGCGLESPVFLSCGAKNAGKSMFNRCAINTTLKSVPEVAYLECDAGQTEFSPPATLSLHIIKKPIFSVPFCHQRTAEKMIFYGDTSPVQDPKLYLKCLQTVFEAYKQLTEGKKLPLIVNTMGFPTGIGLMVFVDTLNIVHPDFVVQFESDNRFLNYPPVTREMIALDEGWTFNKCAPSDVKERVSEIKEHTLLMLNSVKKDENMQTSYKVHPADLRNLAMYAALCDGLCEKETLSSLTPYVVPYQGLAMHVCWHKLQAEEILVALDTAVVALCEADLTEARRHSSDLPLVFDELPICDCLGLGIIRGVDTEKGLLYIVTTLPRHLLTRTNTIVKGTLALSDHFVLKQINTSDYSVPYVDSLARSTAAFGLKTRSRMPRLSKHPKRVA